MLEIKELLNILLQQIYSSKHIYCNVPETLLQIYTVE